MDTVANKQMKNNHHFGALKVGTLVDGFGPAADAPGAGRRRNQSPG